MNGQPNASIRCGVCSCQYHDRNHCTLDSIHVEPMPNASTGTPADESMCASYKSRKPGA